MLYIPLFKMTLVIPQELNNFWSANFERCDSFEYAIMMSKLAAVNSDFYSKLMDSTRRIPTFVLWSVVTTCHNEKKRAPLKRDMKRSGVLLRRLRVFWMRMTSDLTVQYAVTVWNRTDVIENSIITFLFSEEPARSPSLAGPSDHHVH